MSGLKKRGPARRHGKRRKRDPGKICAYCGRGLSGGVRPGVIVPVNMHTRDHVIPAHAGGTIKVPCCFECNHLKGGMSPSAWLAFVIVNMPHRAEAVRNVFRSFNLRWDEPAAQPGERV